VGKGDDPKVPKTTAANGIGIKIGDDGEAAVAYDLDLCRIMGAWVGNFTSRKGGACEPAIHGGRRGGLHYRRRAGFLTPPPKARGKRPGLNRPVRPRRTGPRKAFYVSGDKIILQWSVGVWMCSNSPLTTSF